MKLWDIVKNVGGAIVSEVVPGGSLIVKVVNEFLPDDDKLPEVATGNDISNAISKLPPQEQSQVLIKEFDVTLEQIKQEHSTVRTMLENDAKNPHTTRPYIAKQSFHVVAFVTILMVSTWVIGIYTGDTDMVSIIVDGWAWILAVLGPLVTLLYAYFGVLRKENEDKLNAANGQRAVSGIGALIGKVMGR
jgi:hypothetical protein